MKLATSTLIASLAIALIAPLAFAQGSGSGAPSAVGQTDTPQAAASAEKAVAARHDRVVQKSNERAAKRAAKRASKAASDTPAAGQ